MTTHVSPECAPSEAHRVPATVSVPRSVAGPAAGPTTHMGPAAHDVPP